MAKLSSFTAILFVGLISMIGCLSVVSGQHNIGR